MIKHYFRVAFRNILRNRSSAAINIGGLAIGMAIAMLIGLWVYDEVSFDKQIPGHERIAAVMQNQLLSDHIDTWWGQAKQLAPALRKDFGSRFKHVVIWADPGQVLVGYGDKNLKTKGVYTDPEITDMLHLDFVNGNRTALSDPSSVILSAAAAKSFFGGDDPLGKTLKVGDHDLLKVTGVYANLPDNSSFQGVDFIVPFEHMEHTDSTIARLNWGNSWFNTYVELNDNEDMAVASRAIKDVKYHYSEGDRRFKPELFLHPLDNWHLRSDFRNGVNVGGRIQYVRLFVVIGIFVLFLACINFMNLSTARSEKRAKEVGVRKAIGSGRGALVGQFFGESVAIALLAFVLSIGIAQLLLPFFDGVAGKRLNIPWGQPLFWLAGLCFAFITGLLAGSYPALYLSSFKPVKVLRGTFRAGRLASLPRKALVVVQFTVSVILVIGTIAVFHQIEYVKDRPVGFSRDGLVLVSLASGKIKTHYDAVRRELQETGLIEDIAGSQNSPVNAWGTNMGYSWRGKDPSLIESFGNNQVTPEFGRVVGWHVVEGRDFSRALATDSDAYIINEAAARYMGFKHPVGEVVRRGESVHVIVGVVKDIVSQSPFELVRQTIYSFDTSSMRFVNVRVKPQASMERALAAMGAIFKKYAPEDPFEYKFADEDFAKKFENEERVGKLAGFFTALAIFISCLGLLGLSAFVAEQRMREVGIRKVLGASVLNLWDLLSREFVWLVGLSLLIGAPVSWWIMHGWLGGYRIHAGLSWWIFAGAALGALAVTLLTVSVQTVRAALGNPVRALRSE
jgi:ABC-type antimicrobial peptide transport system permease subunit